MSGAGDDPEEYTPGNQPDGSYSNIFPTSPQPGLFGGEYADMQAKEAANGGMNWVSPIPLADLSDDGTGLPPSVTIAPYLPQLTDPDSSLQQTPGFTDDSLGLPASAQPIANVVPGQASPVPASFNAYGWLHDFLNRPLPSKTLQFAQDLSRSFERNGSFAAGLGATGAGIGIVTADPVMAGASGLLTATGAGFDLAGKLGDMGTSFLKSIQQDNVKPLGEFGRRVTDPGYPDLEIPDS